MRCMHPTLLAMLNSNQKSFFEHLLVKLFTKNRSIKYHCEESRILWFDKLTILSLSKAKSKDGTTKSRRWREDGFTLRARNDNSKTIAPSLQTGGTVMSLKEKLAKKIPELREEIKSLVKEHGQKVITQGTIEQAYGGMRGIKCMVWETSLLDPMEGIRFRGYSIPEIREKLPKAKGGEEPLPEGIFWLLLTGELPSEADVKEVTKEWQNRGKVPASTWIVSLPGWIAPVAIRSPCRNRTSRMSRQATAGRCAVTSARRRGSIVG